MMFLLYFSFAFREETTTPCLLYIFHIAVYTVRLNKVTCLKTVPINKHYLVIFINESLKMIVLERFKIII